MCVEVYFGSCTNRFLYLVHLGFSSYCIIIIMSCNSTDIILIFLNIIAVVQNLVFHDFPYSSPPPLSVFLLSALLISARHVAAYY